MSKTSTSYAFRYPDGVISGGDMDDELYVGRTSEETTRGDLRSYVPATDPSPEAIRRLQARAKRDGLELLARTTAEVVKTETSEWAPVALPLPTTVGSVIELEGIRYSLTSFGIRGANWIRLAGGGKTFYEARELTGATVLFEAPEVTA
jgi:hypothetical protein